MVPRSQRRVFEESNPGLYFTPARFAAFSDVASEVFQQLNFPAQDRVWNGSVAALEALIDRIVPPYETPEEREARLAVSARRRVVSCRCLCLWLSSHPQYPQRIPSRRHPPRFTPSRVMSRGVVHSSVT